MHCAGIFIQQDEQCEKYDEPLFRFAVYASDVQVQVDQKVGAIANTPTGLPPTAHLKANPSHMVT